MAFTFDERSSDSPLVELVYRTRSVGSGTFISNAESHWEMVITKQRDKTILSMRGPESKASLARIPEDAEFLGIIFKLGAFMPHLPTSRLVNEEIHLPEMLGGLFHLYGSAWEFPTFENADVFVNRLIRQGVLVCDPVIEAALQDHRLEMSSRSVQRRFLRATGLTHGMVRQIQRAQKAAAMLRQGSAILDVVYAAGYADQPHLTRALKLFMGHTPAQIIRVNQPD
ncbi:MAG: AraC family transcriptional regulator [Anaerolineae bacterium]|nr:AraC family transcriptional regulator [Anaerolineae bacterium]